MTIALNSRHKHATVDASTELAGRALLNFHSNRDTTSTSAQGQRYINPYGGHAARGNIRDRDARGTMRG